MFMKARRQMSVGQNIASLGGASAVFLEYGSATSDDGDLDGGPINNSNKQKSDFGALLFLPPENTHESMETLIANLSTLNTHHDNIFQHLLHHEFQYTKVNLSLPRFKLSYGTKSIKAELKQLGITAAFDENGMLDSMTHDPLVHLDNVFHKAAMEVTEEGTVAAAATGAIIMTRSIVKYVDMKFDRPFLMFVIHLETGLPLFIGRVDDPELLF